MSNEARHLYAFGPFRLDPRGPVLLRDGQPVSLAPKTIETLLLLVENAGNLVTKDELMQRVWPDSLVEEGNLAKNIFFLRRVLGREEAGRDYIETVPKRGYRFVARVGVKGLSDERASETPANRQPAEKHPAEAGAEKPGSLLLKSPGARLRLLLATGLVLLAGIGVAIYRRPRVPPLTTQDSILISGFSNRTGDPVFDGTLKTALEATLEESPYLNVVSRAKVADTLKLMAKPPDTPMTDEIGREVCLRNGSKAMVSGSVGSVGRRYVITLKAVNAASGDILAEELAEADSKEQVLLALGEAATALRRKLGESLSSLQKFDTPLEEATTSSLDALKAYSLGLARWSTDDAAGSIPLFQHAIELDPEFAAAYAALGRARQRTGEAAPVEEAIRKAYALRNRASEREKFDITSVYFQFATCQLDETIRNCRLWKEIYPRDLVPHRILGFEYAGIGRWEDSAEEFGAANHLDPSQYLPYAGLLSGYLALGRLTDAHAVYRQALSRGLGGSDLEIFRYLIAFLEGDSGTMAKVAASLADQPEFEGGAAANTEAYFGRLGNARELWRQAIAIALSKGENDSAAGFAARAALREALFGNATVAREDAGTVVRLSARVQNHEPEAALAFALAGDSRQARALADNLAKSRPLDSALNTLWLPEVRSVLMLREGKAAAAVDELAPAETWELGWTNPPLMPAYLRGQAWLAAGRGAEAASEFRKILDHPGVVLNVPIGSLAHLGLGRAYALSAAAAEGDRRASFRAQARTAYEEFLTKWKGADPQIPVLRQARSEYAQLR